MSVLPANISTPVAVSIVDPITGVMLSVPLSTQDVKPYGANYTRISTSGTTTVDPGPGGLYYGVSVLNAGTLWTATAYDIVVSGTSTATNPLSVSTSLVLGIGATAGPPSLGVRYSGALVVVTSGTLAGNLNCLWD